VDRYWLLLGLYAEVRGTMTHHTFILGGSNGIKLNMPLEYLAGSEIDFEFVTVQEKDGSYTLIKKAIPTQLEDHQKLLARIEWIWNNHSEGLLVSALKEVVELHKPVKPIHKLFEWACSSPDCLDSRYNEPNPYPCETIKTIERVLM